MVFAVIGIILAFGYILIANMLDTTVKTSEEIEKICKIPVLAVIPIIHNFDKEVGGRRK